MVISTAHWPQTSTSSVRNKLVDTLIGVITQLYFFEIRVMHLLKRGNMRNFVRLYWYFLRWAAGHKSIFNSRNKLHNSLKKEAVNLISHSWTFKFLGAESIEGIIPQTRVYQIYFDAVTQKDEKARSLPSLHSPNYLHQMLESQKPEAKRRIKSPKFTVTPSYLYPTLTLEAAKSKKNDTVGELLLVQAILTRSHI